jgi:ATP-binding cassette subfamily B protein
VLLSIEPSVVDPERQTPLPALAENSVGRRVSYEAVDFTYRGGGEVLSGFKLEIPAGQTVALIGPSGSGKSTLAKLLARLYDPSAGRILLDRVDLRSVSNDELRKAMVMVPQEGFLFSGTVAENIALGRPDASPEEIRRASIAVGADQFVNALQDGYQADVGSRGGRFSAGQQQLIALARVFLVNPSIVVFDEATSAIDIPTERALHEAMRAVLHGRTAMIIAHRLSTLQIADRVLVLADGRIVEDCTPTEFLADRRRRAQADRRKRGAVIDPVARSSTSERTVAPSASWPRTRGSGRLRRGPDAGKSD